MYGGRLSQERDFRLSARLLQASLCPRRGECVPCERAPQQMDVKAGRLSPLLLLAAHDTREVQARPVENTPTELV